MYMRTCKWYCKYCLRALVVTDTQLRASECECIVLRKIFFKKMTGEVEDIQAMLGGKQLADTQHTNPRMAHTESY